MPDFSHLLKKPSGQAKKPPALPIGDYPGVVKSFEIGDSNKNKTPYVRFHLALTGWPDTVPAEDMNHDGEPIDLSKKQLRRDFFLTEDALWRLDDMLRSCQVSGVGELSYEEVLPNVVGAQVTVEVQQYLNQNNNEIGNQVGRVVGAS